MLRNKKPVAFQTETQEPQLSPAVNSAIFFRFLGVRFCARILPPCRAAANRCATFLNFPHVHGLCCPSWHSLLVRGVYARFPYLIHQCDSFEWSAIHSKGRAPPCLAGLSHLQDCFSSNLSCPIILGSQRCFICRIILWALGSQ